MKSSYAKRVSSKTLKYKFLAARSFIFRFFRESLKIAIWCEFGWHLPVLSSREEEEEGRGGGNQRGKTETEIFQILSKKTFPK